MIEAAIIAGGGGERIGRCSKALLDIQGRSIFERQAEVLERIAVRRALVLAPPGSDEHRRPEKLTELARRLSFDCLSDSFPQDLGIEPDTENEESWGGPLPAIHAALRWMRGDCLVILAGDIPEPSAELLQHLIGVACAHNYQGLCVRSGATVQPLVSILSASAIEAVESLLSTRRFRASLLFEAAFPGFHVLDDKDVARACDLVLPLRPLQGINTQAELDEFLT